MRKLHSFVMLVLLLTVPFQAALGATGFLCLPGTHHVSVDAPASHHHNSVAPGNHHHGDGSSVAHQHATVDPAAQDSHDASGKCKVCSECCFTAAPIPASPVSVFPPDTPLRVSSIVEPGMPSRAGDGFFRPPRTTAA